MSETEEKTISPGFQNIQLLLKNSVKPDKTSQGFLERFAKHYNTTTKIKPFPLGDTYRRQNIHDEFYDNI